MGEYYEAGELGRTDLGGVEGGPEVRAMSVWQLGLLAVEVFGGRFALSSFLSDMMVSRISLML